MGFFTKIFGTSGSETVQGTSGNDIVVGKGGDDVVRGGAGNDIVIGGKGNDDDHGGKGNDLLIGGSGNDRLTGGGDGDALWGGKGADTSHVDANGFKSVLLDFSFKEGDRIDIPAGYTMADAKIVDNGFKLFGVTVTFSHGGEIGPQMVIFGVDKVADVHADWFI